MASSEMNPLSTTVREPPEIDIVTVSYNGAAILDRAIDSFRGSVGVRARTIVVDNASTDDSPQAAFRAGAHVISLPRNVGYGAALNAGLKEATAEWVACANQDIELSPVTVLELIRAAADEEARSGVPCIASPRILTARGETAETCHDLPTFGRQVLAFLAGETHFGARNVSVDELARRRCGWVSAVFLVGRRSTFEAVGGFDPSYFMYVEDVEFFTRVAARGYQCLWVPDVTLTHFGGRSKLLSPALYGQALCNWKKYFTARNGRAAGEVVLVAGTVGCLLRSLLWSFRSWRGDRLAGVYAKMFSGAAAAAVRAQLVRSARGAA